MTRPFPLRAPAMVAVLAALLVGCEQPVDRAETPDRPIDAETAQAPPDLRPYLRPSDSTVTVTATGCGTGNQPLGEVTVVVEPWEAQVNEGSDFAWVVDSASDMTSVRIRRKGNPAWPAADLPEGRPGDRIPAGAAVGKKGDRIQYDILIRCRNATLVIDPDIVIRDPNDWLTAW
jgi:hypothetical protein